METIKIDDKIMNVVESAIKVALEYEALRGRRKLGITGEIGEVLVCYHLYDSLGLRLVKDPRSEGYDAVHRCHKKVQIKTRRSESPGLPGNAGRTSRFSKHSFDYALLGILDHDTYQLCEVWRADYDSLKPIIEKREGRNPSLSSFKCVGKQIWPCRE